MFSYIVGRLLLIPPTLLLILLLNFFLVQLAPGGPIEALLAKQQGISSVGGQLKGDAGATETLTPQTTDVKQGSAGGYQGRAGIAPRYIEALEKKFHFDQPLWKRYAFMVWDYLRFDFGNSYQKDQPVLTLIKRALPVSISLGLWSFLLTYLISIPLGIRKARKEGSSFDSLSSFVLVLSSAVPAFLIALFLQILVAVGPLQGLLPFRGLTSSNFEELSAVGKVIDYFKHILLPTIALTIGSFISLAFLTKNSFLDEFSKVYVKTAQSKGLSKNKVLYGHVFRNAMLIVIASFPAQFITLFFTGSVLIEYAFDLQGLGYLGIEAVLNRDYPIIFATLYIFGLVGLLANVITDVTYTLIDPRITFNRNPFS